MTVLLAWTIPVCLTLFIGGRLIDRHLDRGHEIRWHERFYAPQLPARAPRRVIDVDVAGQPRRPQGIPMLRAKCAANNARPR